MSNLFYQIIVWNMKKHSHARVIEILGGRAHLRQKYGISRQLLHYWENNGIPENWRYRLSDYAAQAKIKLPEGFRP